MKSIIAFLREALFTSHSLKLHLGILLPAVVMRSGSLLSQFETESFDPYGAVLILRGLCSDVAMSFLLVATLGWILAKRRTVYLLWAALWSVTFSCNAEHIAFNDSNFNVLLAEYAVTGEFIGGSVLVGRIFLYSFVAGLVSVAAILLLERRPFKFDTRPLYLGMCGVTFLGLMIPSGAEYENWIYENLLETNTRHLWHLSARDLASDRRASSRAALSPELQKKYLSADLSGVPRLDTKIENPNILLVLIEGLAASHLNERTMPFLSEFARQNIRYENFYAHQLLTIKGMYSLLSGDYPNLQYVDCKADILGSFGTDRDLLPRKLSQMGYSTMFLQSAPLGFMRKDLFAANAGFQEIYGASHFDSWHHKNAWGVDDRTLFERALSEIKRIGATARPWMLTLLTTGTHHPYNVPPGFGGKQGDYTLEDAVLYADTHLRGLVEGLQRLGELDDTLVFITSDEVKGDFLQGVRGAIEHYRSPLVVQAPGGHRETVESYFGHVDFYLSVLDYLDAPSIPEDLIGRSLFRRYSTPRSLLIGRANDVAVLEGSDRVHFVPHGFESVTSYRKSEETGEFVALNGTSTLPGEIEKVVNAVDLSSSDFSPDIVFKDSNRYLIENTPVFAQLSFSVKKGERLIWEVGLSTKDIPSGLVSVKMYAGFPREGKEMQYVFYDEFQVNPKSEISFRRSFEAPTDLPRVDNWLWVNTPPGEKTFLKYAYIKRESR